jgi:hypothetical protein
MEALDQNHFKAVLDALRQTDPDVESIVVYSAFVVAYLLQQDGANSGWRKANVNGPVYIIRRRVAPRYQLLVKNKDTAGLQYGASDISDFLHPDWGLDCQKNYVFYKVEDPAKRIRGLWFNDDREREKVEEQLNRILEELRSQPLAPIPSAPAPGPASAPAAAMDNHFAMAQQRTVKPQGAPAQDRVVLNISSLRAAWHALADDEDFMRSIMQKLRDAQQ